MSVARRKKEEEEEEEEEEIKSVNAIPEGNIILKTLHVVDEQSPLDGAECFDRIKKKDEPNRVKVRYPIII